MAQKILLVISLALNVIILGIMFLAVFTSTFDNFALEKGLPKYCNFINEKFPDKTPIWCPYYLVK